MDASRIAQSWRKLSHYQPQPGDGAEGELKGAAPKPDPYLLSTNEAATEDYLDPSAHIGRLADPGTAALCFDLVLEDTVQG